MGLPPSQFCKRCITQEEDSNHLFFQCPNAKQMWKDLIDKTSQPYKLNLTHFSSSNCFDAWKNTRNHKYNNLLLWFEILLYCLWTIWTNRNDNTFSRRMAFAFFNQAYSQAVEFSHIHSNSTIPKTITTTNVK